MGSKIQTYSEVQSLSSNIKKARDENLSEEGKQSENLGQNFFIWVFYTCPCLNDPHMGQE